MDAAQGGATPPADGAATTLTPPQTAAMPTGPYELPGNTPDEQYQYAFGLLRQANYPEAERALRTFIERNPTSPLAGNAQYWLGETFYVRGDYKNAAVAFAEGYQKYPDSGKAPDNLLKLGMSLVEIGSKSDACTALGQLDKQFPGAPANIKERAVSERQRLGC
jgi:tol-pal system protein YbgF